MNESLCDHDMNPLWCHICQEQAREKERIRMQQAWRKALEQTLDGTWLEDET